jgi:hypothetical protein
MASIAAPMIAPSVAPGSGGRLAALAARSAPFGGRYGNPWVAGGGMSPVAERAYFADQRMLQEGIRPSTPGTSVTHETQPSLTKEDLYQLLLGQGLSASKALKQADMMIGDPSKMKELQQLLGG